METWVRNLLIFSLISLLIVILAGCTPTDKQFQETPATFWDGIWHGIISPFYGFNPPKPAQTTSGYTAGFVVGVIWVLLWSLFGAMGMSNPDTGENPGCLGGCFMGIIVGAIIYWPLYLLIPIMTPLKKGRAKESGERIS